MDKISIRVYEKRNREKIAEAISKNYGKLLSGYFAIDKLKNYKLKNDEMALYIDVSMLLQNEDRIPDHLATIEGILEIIISINNQIGREFACIMMERKFFQTIKDYLYYKINDSICLEEYFELIPKKKVNIVDLSEDEFNGVMELLEKNHFGNLQFKRRLKEELRKYRLFNKTGFQPIFSVFICGSSGTGKTEIARLLHKALSPNEPMIKINFGNYSAKDALSSLIGSPRGYVGSSKGELTEKLSKSESSIILIDEFEKADKAVYNFFLQVLEDGFFTDSLGREYDLRKYVIVFTSNIQKEKVGQIISPELRSRFSYKASFKLLDLETKKKYLTFKYDQMIMQIKETMSIEVTEESKNRILNINCEDFNNIRELNAVLMNNIAKELYTDIVEYGG